ncbi:MAG: excinuclease ABC subunit UvrA [Flavobacteriales bacterium]|nr:excinuclease ABC subunit UvrA [Flavobacteriales bacterium]
MAHKHEVIEPEYIEVIGARENNLQNIDVRIPRDKLVVITGLSGSGKSSLAFDTLYAEGQRRYIETFSAYARQFLGNLERPEVDQITGLSPVISIEQKTISRHPRSTVGTITEIYDFLRLLYARASTAYSYNTGEKMIRYTEDQITELIIKEYKGKKIALLSPLVKGRKGHYRELFEQILKWGFLRARIDGEIHDLTDRYKLDRYKIHDIEIVIDRLIMEETDENRIKQSVKTALKYGKGILQVLDMDSEETRFFSKFLMCPTTGISYSNPEPNLFSFNSPYGACSKCNGLGEVAKVDKVKVIPDARKSIKAGGIEPLGKYKDSWIFRQVKAILEQYGFKLTTAISDLSEDVLDKILYGTNENLKVERTAGVHDYSISFEGVVNFIERQAEDTSSRTLHRWANSFMNKVPCPTCNGARLKKEALYFKLGDKNIHDVVSMDIRPMLQWFDQLDSQLSEKQKVIAREPLKEIIARTGFLVDVGLDYLTLQRSAKTLSGGEAQRIRLATQIGSELTGVLYILDEPSIGLHQRDNHRLIDSLKKLRDSGNSVIVVEHDKDIMLEADHLIDIGPGAGNKGGRIVGQGNWDEFNGQSMTSAYLTGKETIPIPDKRMKGNGKKLTLIGASGHNLQDIDLSLPLGCFVCVTGVSGSGKSSLINQTLYPILNNYYFKGNKDPLPYQKIKGLDHLDKVIEIDQAPIGRTPRSNPATYTDLFGEIRKLFTQTPEAKIRGYKPGRFSFNTSGGRCETCKGAGSRTIEMNFLPDVHVQCETCNGSRYNRETLEVRFKSKSIADVLDMTVNEACVFFKDHPRIFQKLITLKNVGLGYIHLGQSSTTLSGGEAQRIKLSKELSKKSTGSTLYILDEPTTGLHFEDIKLLLKVLLELRDLGNTILVIEHNMDIIKMADHIIDMGPEGGRNGGMITAEGTPEELAKEAESYTADYLRLEL